MTRTSSPLALRRAVAWLALAALLLRAALPPGFMPAAPSGETGIAIAICSAGGPKTLRVDGDGQPLDRENRSADCPFAAVPLAALPPPSPSLPSPSVGRGDAAALPGTSLFVGPLRSGALGARAPPPVPILA